MKHAKHTVGAILSLILLAMIAFFGLGAVALLFTSGDGPGWALILLVMFVAPLVMIYGAVRRSFGPVGFGFGAAWPTRKRSDEPLIMPDGSIIRPEDRL